MRCLTLALFLFLAACQTGDNLPDDSADVDAVTASLDAAVDAVVDAVPDAETIPRPPLPMPSPCDTCVGFSCEAVCADAGVDAP